MMFEKPRFGMKEAEVKKQVVAALDLHGWFVIRIHQSMGSLLGISDLIVLKRGQVLFVELKNCPGPDFSGTRKVVANHQSEHQVKFQKKIEDHGGRYVIARSGYGIMQVITELGLNDSRFK